MKILLDECVDWRLLRDLQDYSARSVKQLGWEHIDDGALLALAATEFDVLITVDKDLPNEQEVAAFDIAVIVLRARTTRLPDLRELLSRLHLAVVEATPGCVQIIDWRDPA